MDNWIEQMNYPVVDIEWVQAGRVRLSQKRYVENPNGTDPETFKSGYEDMCIKTYIKCNISKYLNIKFLYLIRQYQTHQIQNTCDKPIFKFFLQFNHGILFWI